MNIKFRTEVEVSPLPISIGYSTPTLLFGSCFTEYIGSIMQKRKFPVLINPFGVVYNPISIKLILERILNTMPFTEDDINFRNGLWFSFLHHTSFSSPQKVQCLDKINKELENSINFIKESNYILITFGTARVYYLKEDGRPVANCHKIPAKEFDNRLLSVDEIFVEWSVLLNMLSSVNKDLKVIFTVSPVRHWKDGAHENQLSKSVLHLAINELIKNDPERLFYFPAYELMMDDLRDYRFYGEDMLHPTQGAVNYIWEKFSQTALDESSLGLMNEIEKVIAATSHRPFNPGTTEHQNFISNTLNQIQGIKKVNPSLDFSEEEDLLRAFLK